MSLMSFYGGEKPPKANTGQGNKDNPINNKRNADILNDGPAALEAPDTLMSKRQQKKLAKQQAKDDVSSKIPGKGRGKGCYYLVKGVFFGRDQGGGDQGMDGDEGGIPFGTGGWTMRRRGAGCIS